MGKSLAGKVALVAGATRGAGRGIARMLGEAGCVVYCSGRSSRTQANTSGHDYAGQLCGDGRWCGYCVAPGFRKYYTSGD